MVGFFGDFWMARGYVAVVIPAAMVELDEADVALGKAAGEEAVGGVGAGDAGVFAIKFEGAGGFFAKVGEIGHTHLHSVRHLVCGDAGINFGVAGIFAAEGV